MYACMPIAWLVFMLAWAWKKGLDMTWGSLQSTRYTATADTQQTRGPILLLSSTVSHLVWLLKGYSDEIFDSRLVLFLNQYISLTTSLQHFQIHVRSDIKIKL
jgi:hypothetical protein